MLKITHLVVALLVSVTAFSQSFYNYYSVGLKEYNKGDFKQAYYYFTYAEKDLDISSISNYDLADYYYHYGISTLKFDSTLIKQASARLGTSATYGLFKAFEYLAMDAPVISSVIAKQIEHIKFKKEPVERINYLKAIIFAKMDSPDVRLKAFDFLSLALAQKYTLDNPLDQPMFTNINYAQYIDLIYQYKLIDSRYNYLLKYYVEDRINQSQIKGKYEKMADNQARVNETTRQNMIAVFSKQFIDSVGTLKYNLTTSQNEYDPENETFLITFESGKRIIVPVPVAEAPLFDQNFANLTYKNASFTLRNDEFELVSVTIANPANDKQYAYSSLDVTEFNPTLMDYKFNAVEIKPDDMPGNTGVISQGIDIETNIPVTSQQNPYAFALIIGNEDYQTYQTGLKNEQNVEFAIRDANLVKEYCIKTLGIPQSQILFYANAGTVTMNQAVQQVQQIIKSTGGKASVLVYYAGHGYPDAKTQEPCLIPVDVNSSTMDFALPLSKLLGACTAYPAEKVVFMLDACFSGGGRNMGLMAARGVTITPKDVALSGNVVVFSASAGNQTALPYRDQKHGMFTYYMLKKLQETNGNATLADLDAFISEKVPVQAAIVNKQEQTPVTQISPMVQTQWTNWNLK